MIYRFTAALLSVVAIATPAWADGSGADPTSLSAWAAFLKDGGPWAFLVIAGYVIWTQRNEIRDLNKSLVTATGKAESVAGAVTNALSSLEAASKVAEGRNTERWEAVKGMSTDLVRVATLVAANAGAIESLRTAVGGLSSPQGSHRGPH